MTWLKKNGKTIVAVVLIIFILGMAYFSDEFPSEINEKSVEEHETEITSENCSESANESKTDADVLENTDEKVLINSADSESIQPEEKSTDLVCTLSVRCDTINVNLDLLDESKKTIVPSDGIIFEKSKLIFYEGESVFDVLLREMKNNKIHFEYVDTPMYNSVYIEGINNIYEFDCGSGSGWLYKVNGKFPSCGCSQYILENNDVIEIVYTCNMGKDVGRN